MPLDKGEVARRLTDRAGRLGLKQSEIAKQLGIPKTTMGRIWNGENLPDSAILFPLSDLLDISPRWLLYGGSEAPLPDTRDDWLSLPHFEFARISARGKGEPTGMVPLSRNWLEGLAGNDGDLWLTEMPNDLLADIAGEGDAILCSDIQADIGALSDGRIYLLLLDGQPLIRRVSFAPEAILLSTSSARVPPIRLARSDSERAIHPVARVRGALRLTAF